MSKNSAWLNRPGTITKALVALGCLGLSAVALAGVTRLEGARRGAPEPSVAEARPPAPLRVKAPTKAQVTLASVVSRPIAPARDDKAALLTIPDFKGKRLSTARREGKKLGIVLAA